jgi:hypothetical protein
MHWGSCLCKAVTFEVSCELPPANACHCIQCRKHSGHFEASTDVPRSAVKVNGSENITWYNLLRRFDEGFALLVDPHSSRIHWTHRNMIGRRSHWEDTPTKTRLKAHIFVAEKGDYYEIGDGLPQNQH